VIRVLPLEQICAEETVGAAEPLGATEPRGGAEPLEAPAGGGDPLVWARHRRFTASGRAALDAVLGSLGLSPSDDVLITNASGQKYVSACVTSTVFNHCRPSRVLTSSTRAMIVIHEYGYPHPRLTALLGTARERGIPLIEDCAHSLDSGVAAGPLGSFGDFAIFSLPKVLPVAAGGVLVSRAGPLPGPLPGSLPEPGLEAPPGSERDAAVEAAYHAHLPALPEYTRRRRRNYEAVVDAFAGLPLLLEAGPEVTPWYVGLITPEAWDIRRRSSAIEWGSTVQEDLLLVTTNQFVAPEALIAALKDALTRPKDRSWVP
jgi:hypothetical protein